MTRDGLVFILLTLMLLFAVWAICKERRDWHDGQDLFKALVYLEALRQRRHVRDVAKDFIGLDFGHLVRDPAATFTPTGLLTADEKARIKQRFLDKVDVRGVDAGASEAFATASRRAAETATRIGKALET